MPRCPTQSIHLHPPVSRILLLPQIDGKSHDAETNPPPGRGARAPRSIHCRVHGGKKEQLTGADWWTARRGGERIRILVGSQVEGEKLREFHPKQCRVAPCLVHLRMAIRWQGFWECLPSMWVIQKRFWSLLILRLRFMWVWSRWWIYDVFCGWVVVFPDCWHDVRYCYKGCDLD